MNVVALPTTPPPDDVQEPDWEALLPFPGDIASDLDVGAVAFNTARARKDAHAEWQRITTAMRETETLAAVNARQIQRLILAYVRHDHAVAETVRTGAIRLAPKTRVQMLNLWSTVASQASTEASLLEAELGLTPRRRGAVTKVTNKKRAARASDAYIRTGAAAGSSLRVG